MIKSKIVGLSAYLKETASKIEKYWVDEQNARFIKYAEAMVKKIGDRINEYHSRNHMDRTGNLLDSLCWGVSYKGKLVASGYYRENRKATGDSYLHERWGDGDLNTLYPVNGRKFAQEYLEKYGNNSNSQKWRVFFAILAPYWGYWENGFTMKSHFGESTRFLRFAVMTEFFDVVKKDLKPARVRYHSSVPKYTRKGVNKRRDKEFEGKIKDYYNYGNPNLK